MDNKNKEILDKNLDNQSIEKDVLNTINEEVDEIPDELAEICGESNEENIDEIDEINPENTFEEFIENINEEKSMDDSITEDDKSKEINDTLDIQPKMPFSKKVKKVIENKKTIGAVAAISIIANIGQAATISSYKNKLFDAYSEELALETELEQAYIELENSNRLASAYYSVIETLSKKVNSASAWFSLSDDQQKSITAKINDLKQKEDAEKLVKEKEKYNTGITYKQLVRNPEGYNGEYCKFKGEVLQVIENRRYSYLRIAVNNNPNDMLYVKYNPSIVDSRVLEGDIVTIYGISTGLYTYVNILGMPISMPSMNIDKLDIQDVN